MSRGSVLIDVLGLDVEDVPSYVDINSAADIGEWYVDTQMEKPYARTVTVDFDGRLYTLNVGDTFNITEHVSIEGPAQLSGTVKIQPIKVVSID